MVKPDGYDDARVSGEYVPVELGGHYCKIVQVTETKSSKGKDMIVVLFDFCSPDQQEGYFSKSYANDPRDKKEKKWPFQGSKYIMVNDYQDPKKTSSQFKTFCSCIEKSNNCEINWVNGPEWAQQFKGKKVGVVYGEEENEYNGKTFMRATPKWFCRTDAVKDASIPKPKYLAGAAGPTMPTTGTDGFMNIPDGMEDEIPF